MTATTPSPSVLTQFVQRARRLYTLPAVAMKVIELTGHPKVDTRKLKECIENDPALTAKLLRVVNSSLFGLSREITDLNQALALLGVKPLKLLVLGFSLPAELFDGLEASVLERYWRHTLTKAVAAREIAEVVWKSSGDEAFIGGLLQQIGMLALVQDLGETYLTFLDRVLEERGELQALETEALGFDHAILSARLLDHWGLPGSLVRAVGMPQDVDQLAALSEEEGLLPRILHLAELCTVLVTQKRPGTLRELLDAGARYKGLTIEQVEGLVGTLEEKVLQLADVLSLQVDGELNYAAMLAEAHARMAEVAEQMVMTGGPDCESALLHEMEKLGGVARNVARHADELPDPRTTTPVNAADAPQGVVNGAEAAVVARSAAATRSDLGLLGRVSQSVGSCRQARCGVTLLIAQIDHYDELIMKQGLGGARQAARLLEAAVDGLWDGTGACMAQGDGCYALIMEDCDRPQGVELARRLVHGMRDWSQKRSEQHVVQVTVSAGLATLAVPTRNYPAQELIEAAQRCLSAAQLSGGDVVKSIDIY